MKDLLYNIARCMRSLRASLLPSLTGGVWGWVFLLACTSTIDEPQPSRPIAFTSYTAQPITRADSTLMANNVIPGGQSIGVYAYYHDNSTWSDDAVPNFMWNQKATNDGLNQPFLYSPLKYWPNEEEDKLSFIAYYPYTTNSTVDLNRTGIAPKLTPISTGLPSFRFTVKDNVKEQYDFMVSDLIPNLPESRDTDPNPGNAFDNLRIIDRVRFYFRHATSKIEFRVTVADDIRADLAYFTLHSLGITNIYNEALLTTTYTPPVAPATEGTTGLIWSDHKDSHKTDYSCKTTEAYLLLPQTLRNDAKLNISYDLAFKSEGTTYTYDASGNPIASEEYAYNNRSASVQLNTLIPTGSSTPLTTWLPNHHYVYVIRLGAKRIDFTAQVVDWGASIPVNGITVE